MTLAAFLLILGAASLFAQPQPVVLWTYIAMRDDFDYITTSPALAPDGTIYLDSDWRLSAITNKGSAAGIKWSIPNGPRHTGSTERPYFKNPRSQSDGTFTLSFFGHLGRNYSIETSTNLATWTPLSNFPVSNIPIDVFDASATNASDRFYRGRSL